MQIQRKIRGMILCLVLGISCVFAHATTSTEPKVITFDFSKPSTMNITGGKQVGLGTSGNYSEENKITILQDCISIVSTAGYEDSENKIVHFYINSSTAIKCSEGNISKIVLYYTDAKYNEVNFTDGRKKKKNTVGTWT